MNQVGNISIPVPGPQVASPLGAAQGPGVRQPAPIQPPPLRTPQQVLDESKRLFPQVEESVLRGERGLPGLTRSQMTTMGLLAKRELPPGAVPILLQSGGAFKAALMPTQGVPGPDKAANIQGYVREGQAFYERIMNGDTSVPHGKDEVAKVMWFLQALASSKASESSGGAPVPALFQEGSFTIEDPSRNLEHFLAGANSYERRSPHLPEFQKQAGCQPRGVDIRGVPMPNGQKTVLFARMPNSREVAQPGDPNMGQKKFLFLKMEPHGCRGLSTLGTGTGRAGEQAGFFTGLKRFFANLADTIGHAFGFGQPRGLAALNSRNNHEMVPSEVKELYAGLMKRFEAALRNASEEERAKGRFLAEILGRNAPLSSTGGIRVMIENLAEVEENFCYIPEQEYDLLYQGVLDALTLLRGHGDHSQYRLGNEIILRWRDTEISGLARAERPDHQISRQGGLSEKDKGLALAATRYVLANIDNKNQVDIFEADTHRCTYHLGLSGQEQPVVRDTDLAKKTVLDLADGDQRMAKALMTLCNQGFAEPVTSSMSTEGIMSAMSYVLPGNVGEYHISRLPDTPEGAKAYRVGFSFDGPLGQEGRISTLAGTLDLDQEHSRVGGRMFMNVTFHPGGAIEPSFDGEPSFSFTLTPAPTKKA